jgi:hypothetical protein
MRRSIGYFFHLRRAGKAGRRRYPIGAFDLYALVAMDRRAIAYLTPADCRSRQLLYVYQACHIGSTAADRETSTRRQSNVHWTQCSQGRIPPGRAPAAVDSSPVRTLMPGSA